MSARSSWWRGLAVTVLAAFPMIVLFTVLIVSGVLPWPVAMPVMFVCGIAVGDAGAQRQWNRPS